MPLSFLLQGQPLQPSSSWQGSSRQRGGQPFSHAWFFLLTSLGDDDRDVCAGSCSGDPLVADAWHSEEPVEVDTWGKVSGHRSHDEVGMRAPAGAHLSDLLA